MSRVTSNSWTTKQDAHLRSLRDQAPDSSNAALAEVFVEQNKGKKRTKAAVRTRLSNLGLGVVPEDDDDHEETESERENAGPAEKKQRVQKKEQSEGRAKEDDTGVESDEDELDDDGDVDENKAATFLSTPPRKRFSTQAPSHRPSPGGSSSSAHSPQSSPKKQIRKDLLSNRQKLINHLEEVIALQEEVLMGSD